MSQALTLLREAGVDVSHVRLDRLPFVPAEILVLLVGAQKAMETAALLVGVAQQRTGRADHQGYQDVALGLYLASHGIKITMREFALEG